MLVCSSMVNHYDAVLLDEVIAKQFQMLEIDKDLKPGMKVVLKPNLLAARAPAMGVTTHPEVLAAIARWLHLHGIENITLADTPGGVVSGAVLTKLYSTCGLKPLENILKLNTDLSFVKVNGFPILKVVMEADFVINCCKLKTHGLTVMTGAVKNLFGTIPGLKKPEYHCINPSAKKFCQTLIQLCQTVKPAVSVMDAIDCMEGNGPGGGNVRHVGMVLSSRSPYALDQKAVELMGLTLDQVPLMTECKSKGLLNEKITVAGDAILPANPPFTLPDSITEHQPISSFLGTIQSTFFRRKAYPVLISEKCVGCGKCAESCPKHIIHIENGKALFGRKNCISCLCCQEMCPCHAIKVTSKR